MIEIRGKSDAHEHYVLLIVQTREEEKRVHVIVSGHILCMTNLSTCFSVCTVCTVYTGTPLIYTNRMMTTNHVRFIRRPLFGPR